MTRDIEMEHEDLGSGCELIVTMVDHKTFYVGFSVDSEEYVTTSFTRLPRTGFQSLENGLRYGTIVALLTATIGGGDDDDYFIDVAELCHRLWIR